MILSYGIGREKSLSFSLKKKNGISQCNKSNVSGTSQRGASSMSKAKMGRFFTKKLHPGQLTTFGEFKCPTPPIELRISFTRHRSPKPYSNVLSKPHHPKVI